MSNKIFLLLLFGISASFALIGLAAAIFGGIKEIPWLLYSGVAMAVFSIVLSIYANRSLSRILKGNYDRLTKRIDSQFEEARNTLDKIYAKKGPLLNGQNTNPDKPKQQ